MFTLQIAGQQERAKMTDFAGKTAVISGGAEGIGFSIAKALGDVKMNIVLADIDKANLEKASSELEAAGIPVLAVALNVADEAQWQEVAHQAIARFGKIHMVVNNAGVTGDAGTIEQQDAKGWQWTLEVNLMGVVYGAKIMVPLIKQHGEGGWLVNVASMAGMGGIPYGGVYTATKSAVVALTESWAVELSDHQINVSVLCPGFVQTRIHESHRNRPAQYASDNGNSSGSSALEQNAKQMVANGIEVSIVGKRLVEALSAGEMYVFTHPQYRSAIEKRFKAIDAAFESAAQSPLLQDIFNQKV
ncbi:MAG: NAD(P)-dependent dehydrogenase (short-subunit alcohol dehydrogenase family) [Cryomorphaceae bacterium]|jgi:NAD(P)-dependent dehydrogenase (short-subunit alcohol dehydrogenase family)